MVDGAGKEQRSRAKELQFKKKGLQDRLVLIDKKAKNLLGVLGEEGKKSKLVGYILKELDDLDFQATQLRSGIEAMEFEINDLENEIVSADVICDNVKAFKDVYDRLTPDEKYDLLHLLVKKIVYFEEAETGRGGQMRGKIKMDLWELPPINPSRKDSAKGFAESTIWLPGRDAQQNHVAYNVGFLLHPIDTRNPRAGLFFLMNNT